MPRWATVCEAVVFLAFAVFFLVYGVTPIFVGGDGLGLVGADEPRYAQIAHEMLDRFDAAHTLKGRLSACVTPYLYGRPWLEKPALYYWRAMFLFQDFGVHDWTARLPSTTFAFIMVGLIYLHMRRFRPGGHLDAALITVACAGIIGFARGASTDMQMAAPLAIGLLGWYAWYETGSKFWLYDIYFFTGLATLAKGPVAPFLAALIIVAFAFLRREWTHLCAARFWWPGIVLYFAMVLPWFIAVQHQNPTFFREFFLEHNLERFATDRYQHEQPFWYYLVVVVLAMMPWTVIAVRALVDGILTSVAEWRLRHSAQRKALPTPPRRRFSRVSGALGADSHRLLLVLAVQAAGLHSSLHSAHRHPHRRLSVPAPPAGAEPLDSAGPCRGLRGHDHGRAAAAVVCGPRRKLCRRRTRWQPRFWLRLGAALLILVVTKGFGVARLRLATCCVLVVLVLFLYGVGPFFGIPGSGCHQARDSPARPHVFRAAAGRQAGSVAPADETVAVFRVRRDIEYGLSFYRNREVVNYEESGVPDEQHLLVARVTGPRWRDLQHPGSA